MAGRPVVVDGALSLVPAHSICVTFLTVHLFTFSTIEMVLYITSIRKLSFLLLVFTKLSDLLATHLSTRGPSLP